MTYYGPWKMNLPILMQAYGHIKIGSGRIDFAARSPVDRWDKRRRNIDENLTFELSTSDILTIEPYERPSSPYQLTWTLVATTRGAALDEFMLTIGGKNAYAMADYRAKALELRDALQKVKAGVEAELRV
ncbi:MAG: hypothetical protein HY243_01415 [Proteobacteria bacterium]|nr:hypothetical protein [Pseudomonadota bacterium]